MIAIVVEHKQKRFTAAKNFLVLRVPVTLQLWRVRVELSFGINEFTVPKYFAICFCFFYSDTTSTVRAFKKVQVVFNFSDGCPNYDVHFDSIEKTLFAVLQCVV